MRMYLFFLQNEWSLLFEIESIAEYTKAIWEKKKTKRQVNVIWFWLEDRENDKL